MKGAADVAGGLVGRSTAPPLIQRRILAYRPGRGIRGLTPAPFAPPRSETASMSLQTARFETSYLRRSLWPVRNNSTAIRRQKPNATQSPVLRPAAGFVLPNSIVAITPMIVSADPTATAPQVPAWSVIGSPRFSTFSRMRVQSATSITIGLPVGRGASSSRVNVTEDWVGDDMFVFG